MLSPSKHAHREARASWLRALARTADIPRNGVTLPQLVAEQAMIFGSAPALIDEQESLSYAELNARVNAYACWALDRSLGPGDVACVLLPNCADYLALWLGIVCTGATVALVNTGLKGASLAHAIGVVSPRLVIVGAAFADAVASIMPQIGSSVEFWSHGGEIAGFLRLDSAAYGCRTAALRSADRAYPDLKSRALLLYTSGTTGLPKAANVSHLRLMQWSLWFAGLLDAGPTDRTYDCLPLYHSVGGIVAAGAMLASGGSTVIRAKFSASRFWDNLRATECTLFAYVGELCRFLLNGPPHASEREHKIRLCFGNGLAPAVWRPFQQRFGVPRILEFYASTEGSFSLYNCEGEPGAIGRIPGFLRHRIEIALVRIDVETGSPLRGVDGFCMRCGRDETGEALGRLDPERNAVFEGYAEEEATERKILRDVFSKGDAWFRSGDLMRQDARGFFHFVDRIGDSFRCNSENVSTQEVAQTIALCEGVREAVVYGIRMPDVDGRVGMAAIVPDERFDLSRLHRHLEDNLPSYARPRFLRICEALDVTDTFKWQTNLLQREGYDPACTAAPIFIDDKTTFVPLTSAIFARIQCGDWQSLS